jgi:hypothetical protein
VKRAAAVYLPEVDVLVEAVRVARLVVAGRLTEDAPLDGGRDLARVPVEPVHGSACHPQPAAAVDPWSPLPGLRNEVGEVPVVEFLRESAQLPDRQGTVRLVVDAEVHVRVRVRLPAGPRAAQGHRDHPRHVTEPFCDIFRQADRGLQPVPLRILRRQLRMRRYPGAVLAIPDTRKVRWRGQVYEGPHARGFYTWPETLRSCCTAPSTASRQSSAGEGSRRGCEVV